MLKYRLISVFWNIMVLTLMYYGVVQQVQIAGNLYILQYLLIFGLLIVGLLMNTGLAVFSNSVPDQSKLNFIDLHNKARKNTRGARNTKRFTVFCKAAVFVTLGAFGWWALLTFAVFIWLLEIVYISSNNVLAKQFEKELPETVVFP